MQSKFQFAVLFSMSLSCSQAFAIGDCFSDHCTGLETVSSWHTIFALPGGTENNPNYFSSAGALEFDNRKGPELFAVAGKNYTATTRDGKARDYFTYNLHVADTDTQALISEFSIEVTSPKYTPLNIPGINSGFVFTSGGGLVNLSDNKEIVALSVHAQSLLPNDDRGYVQVFVFEKSGELLWRRRFHRLISNGRLQLLDFTNAATGNGVLFGDFLDRLDGKDELRVIYRDTSGTTEQEFSIRYYRARNGNEIRSDEIAVPVPD